MLLSHLEFIVFFPLLIIELSIISSCARVKLWKISRAADAESAFVMFPVKRSDTNNVIKGLNLLPPESNKYFTGS